MAGSKPTSVWLAVSGLLFFGTLVTIFSKSGASRPARFSPSLRNVRQA
jgi:hypothetical protein